MNDISSSKISFSCENKVSATEVETFLEKLKYAVLHEKKKEFSQLLIYPFILYPEADAESFTEELVEVVNSDEIEKKYTSIVTEQFKNVVACVSLSNINPAGSFGILLGRTYIRVEQENNKFNNLKVAMIGTFNKWPKLWYEQNCQ